MRPQVMNRCNIKPSGWGYVELGERISRTWKRKIMKLSLKKTKTK